MGHYVLLFRGDAPRAEDLDLIEQAEDVQVLEHSAARALLIDAPEHAAQRLREQLGDWLVAEEVTHPPPGPAQQEPHGPE